MEDPAGICLDEDFETNLDSNENYASLNLMKSKDLHI